MTKAAVRAMDTITEFLTSPTAPQEIQDLNSNPSQFIVAGASKRGWITWTVASVDPRIMAIVPVVFDELNSKINLHHHFRAYGGLNLCHLSHSNSKRLYKNSLIFTRLVFCI